EKKQKSQEDGEATKVSQKEKKDKSKENGGATQDQQKEKKDKSQENGEANRGREPGKKDNQAPDDSKTTSIVPNRIRSKSKDPSRAAAAGHKHSPSKKNKKAKKDKKEKKQKSAKEATVTAQGTRRVTDLTEEEKERINKMTSAKEMPRPERFGMLKTFIVQQSVASIEVEAPDSVKGRMYKVLKEVVEEKQRRVNEASAKKLLAKQLGEFAANLDSIGFLDVKTGRISGKKAKKALTPEQQAYKDMKGASQKLENQSKTIPTKLAEIRGLKIRNCSELVSALEEIESKVENALALSKGMLEGQKTCPDVEGWNQYMEVNLQPVIDLADHDIKDASKRIQNHKNTEKNKMKSSAQAGNEDPQGASEDDHEDDEDDEESQCADDCGDAGSHSSKSSKDLNLETTVAEKAQSRMDGGEFSHSTKEMRSMFKRMMNTAEFIQYGCKANPWIQLPGFHPSMVVFDWLHVVDLALIPDSAASCLIELTEVPLEQGGIFAGSDQNERLRAAYVDFIAECRKHKISCLHAR
ncbi:unnamed protein product, partial [Symbiodinium necroappetens]